MSIVNAKLLFALTLADLATLYVLVGQYGIAGEFNPLIRSLWAVSPLVVMVYKLGSAALVSASARALGPQGRILIEIGSLALMFGVACNVAGLAGCA